MNDLIGQQIDMYRLSQVMESNPVATIYQAVDVQNHQTVIFKRIHNNLVDDQGYQIRFLQTVQAAMGLTHQAIVPMLSYGQGPSLLYIVMAKVEGHSLGSLWLQAESNSQPIALQETLTIIAQIADALEYAHQNGVVHGQINPNLIFLQQIAGEDAPHGLRLRAQITGFELAESNLDVTNEMANRLPYLSPEQCLGRAVDGRSDIYALGVLLYQLIAGRLPFDIKNATDAITKHPLDPIPDPRQNRADVSANLAAIVMKALAKQPEYRFQHARHFAFALRKVCDGLTVKQMNKDIGTTSLMNSLTAVNQSNGSSKHTPTTSPAAAPAPRPVRVKSQHFDMPAPTFLGSLPIVSDKIVISRSGRTVHILYPNKDHLTIGRLRDSDIILETPDVSRRHAQLSHTADGWQVMDLASTSGTMLAGNRLPPHAPQHWNTQNSIQIGQYEIRWESDQPINSDPHHSQRERVSNMGQNPIGQTPTMLPDADHRLALNPSYQPHHSVPIPASLHQSSSLPMSIPEASPVPTGAMQITSRTGRFRVTVLPVHLEMMPGTKEEVIIELHNLGQTTDYFQFHLSGLNTNWLTILRDSVQIAPGQQAALSFALEPPLHSSSRADSYPYRLTLEMASNPQETAVINGTVTLKPYHRFHVDIQPTQLTARGTCQVAVENEGNTSSVFSVTGFDPAGIIRFHGERGRFKLNHGERITVPLTVEPLKRPFIGSRQIHPFTIRVTGHDNEQDGRSGQLIIKPIVATWMATTVTALLVLTMLAIAAYLAFGAIDDEFAAFNVQATSLAQAASGENGTRIAAAATATGLAIKATSVFATATADAAIIAGDADGDGLSNERESEFGTDPFLADTDGDGLSDGQEVNQFNTDPRNQDSDGDRLLDGDEINIYFTNPNNPDTDGDGRPDGTEIEEGTDPLAAPTAVPTATATPMPTVTVKPGNTIPVARNDAVNAIEDQPMTIAVLENDSDADAGDKLSISNATTSQRGGAVIVNQDGTVTYLPPANFNGADSFTYSITDSHTTATATVSITVAPVNDKPSFKPGPNQTILEGDGTTKSLPWATTILAGPDNETGQSVNFVITNNSNSALFAINPTIDANGTLSYTPAGGNINGTAIISIRLQDSGGVNNGGENETAVVSFTITITPVNDPPTFTLTGTTDTVNEDSGLRSILWVTNISAGPQDEISQSVNFIILSVNSSNPSLFAIAPTISPNGRLDYRPADNQFGSATVTIKLQDNGSTDNGGDNDSDSQMFTIIVVAQNDPPIANNDAINVNEGGAATTLVSGQTAVIHNDIDADNDQLTVTHLSANGPFHAVSFVLNSNGTFSYTHNGSETSSDSFTYEICDPSSSCDQATVTISIAPQNDRPIFTPDNGMVNSNPISNTHSIQSIINTNNINRIQDADTGAVEGVAIVGADNNNGQWQYCLQHDCSAPTAWHNVPSAVSIQAALLLYDSASIRFIPITEDDIARTLTIYAWDRTGDGLVNGANNINIAQFDSPTSPFSVNSGVITFTPLPIVK